MKELTDKERLVLELLSGSTGLTMSVTEVSKHVGVSANRVRQVMYKAVRKLFAIHKEMERQQEINWKCMETVRMQAQRLVQVNIEKWELLDELGRIDEDGREIKKQKREGAAR